MKKVIICMLSLMVPFCIKASTTAVNGESNFVENAKSAILIEQSTGQILYEKNSHEKIAPASMTKMMSLLLIMEDLDGGKIKLDDVVTVSKNASSMGGVKFCLKKMSK